MDGFLLDCCFNSGYEGQKCRESTPRYANRLCAMKHSAKSQLRAMKHSAESQLRAMKHSAETIRQNFDTDSALLSTAQSRLCAMKHSAESRLCTMKHGAELMLLCCGSRQFLTGSESYC
jgi:hypothetical protein